MFMTVLYKNFYSWRLKIGFGLEKKQKLPILLQHYEKGSDSFKFIINLADFDYFNSTILCIIFIYHHFWASFFSQKLY